MEDEPAIRLGTRQSDLALTQSRTVARMLGGNVALVGVVTEGDRLVDVPLRGPLQKGYFTEALEQRLRDGTIDIAVHSLKDLPTAMAPGLRIGAIPVRERVADLLFVRKEAWDAAGRGLPLAAGASVGASSPRRQSLVRSARPDCRPEPLRGNVPTRLKKLAAGQFDAIVLAEAGVRRLVAGEVPLVLDGLHVVRLNPSVWVPAPGQGALAVQCRADDVVTLGRLASLHDAATAADVATERRWLTTIGAGCSVPFGAWVHGADWVMGLERNGKFSVVGGSGAERGDAAVITLMAGSSDDSLTMKWEEIDVCA